MAGFAPDFRHKDEFFHMNILIFNYFQIASNW